MINYHRAFKKIRDETKSLEAIFDKMISGFHQRELINR
jgi:hypothetical protein